MKIKNQVRTLGYIVRDVSIALISAPLSLLAPWTSANAQGSDLPDPMGSKPSQPNSVNGQNCIGTEKGEFAPVLITVDGESVDTRELQATEADRQRCLDTMLARANIQLRFDSLEHTPSLNTRAQPGFVPVGQPVQFATYSNYVAYVSRAEIRIFGPDQSVQQIPLAILPVKLGGIAQWTPLEREKVLLAARQSVGVPDHLEYVLRVYDAAGRFDETESKRLDLGAPAKISSELMAQNERIATEKAYGENALRIHNISVKGGAVTASGDKVPVGNHVTFLGASVPVDSEGHFVARQIMPAGPQQVTVEVLNNAGEGLSFKRNVSIAVDDSFFVAIADLTAGARSVAGPVSLVTGDPTLARTSYVDGRMAFYYKGSVKGSWLLTAAADTQDQPVRDLFSNFARKDPEYLLRRIDPDAYYPVYGDDSTTVEDAPTSGKFYVRLQKNGTDVMWGNFQTTLTGTEFLRYSRTLYGADARYHSQEATKFGEKATSGEMFWADSGTLGAHQEFRATGGSVYYLQNMDVSVGSERLWVEVRDRESGITRSVTPLVVAQDYDINYLQGNIILHSALPLTADTATFVHDAALSGDPVYLVATYEYVPGFSDPSALALGGHIDHWIGDHVEVGASSFHQGDAGEEQNLKGGNLTLRYLPGTYIKGEYAHSDGPGMPTITSITGGLTDQSITTNGDPANAERVELGVDLAEVSSAKGRIAAYYQDRSADFSGPGEMTPTAVGTLQSGGAVTLPVNKTTQVLAKVDNSSSIEQTSQVDQLGVEHEINEHWRVSVGARHDDLNTPLANASTILSQTGSRTDLALTIGYHPAMAAGSTLTALSTANGGVPSAAVAGAPSGSSIPGAPAVAAPANPGIGTALGTNLSASPVGTVPNAAANGTQNVTAGNSQALWLGQNQAPWDVYAFGQGTVSHSGDRPLDDRDGAGGSVRISDNLRLGAEVSDGSQGVGGKVSGNYKVDDHSNVYLNYTLAADQPDALNVGRDAAVTSGARYRYNDSTSIYGEERLETGTGPSGLTHAYGVDFTPNIHWNYGFKIEKGEVSDPLAGDQSVTALAASIGFTEKTMKYAGAIEWRANNSSILGSSHTIEGRNNMTLQLDPDWRLLAKMDWSQTTGDQSPTLNADYDRFVLGAGYRPILNDRWETLFKFTVLNDLPAAAQIANSSIITPYAQHSNVFDIDATYQIDHNWSVGGKYAYRKGELQATETPGAAWFAATANLYIVRIDYMLVSDWDGLFEMRRLAASETRDATDGVLIALYKHIGPHIKAGIGYNFTDYSDDLTDLSYRSRGIFLNVTGKL